MNDLVIVKLGGSAITDKKSGTPKLRPAVLKRLAEEIAKSGKRAIIVHGAGSFGHPLAKKFKLNEGLKEESQKKGFALTQTSVRKLNIKVMDALQNAGINAISLPPGAFVECNGRRISRFDFKSFRRCLEMGFSPVTFGDAVLDSKIGFCICSGDVLAEELAREFKPEKVIFAADVDGIFDRNPGMPGAKLLGEIKCAEIRRFVERPSGVADVTGGMNGKLESIKRIVAKGTPAIVLNGSKKGRLLSAIRGERTICTMILR